MLSRHYGWRKMLEPVENNPYISKYYQDIHRWSFNTEVYFLKQRFRDILRIRNTDETVVQDRSIFEGVYVFAANNRDMGYLTDLDFKTYMDLFQCMMSVVQLPDLMIYLRSSVSHLVKNIEKRDRSYERTMTLDYLNHLNEFYKDFIYHKYKGRILIIDVDELDFEHVPRDFGMITEKIDAEIYGLYSSTTRPESH
jgi:deoxyadenosine/deoxycytidine kinase